MANIYPLFFDSHFWLRKEYALQSVMEEESIAVNVVTKKGGGGRPDDPNVTEPGGHEQTYSQSVSKTFTWWSAQNIYKGGIIRLPNGSEFWVDDGVLIPPPGSPDGAPITMTMTCDKDPDTHRLYFSFQSASCQFEPYAQLFLRWANLGLNHPRLYFINEKDKKLEQQPDIVNHKGQHIMGLFIHHFSRYAVGSE